MYLLLDLGELCKYFHFQDEDPKPDSVPMRVTGNSCTGGLGGGRRKPCQACTIMQKLQNFILASFPAEAIETGCVCMSPISQPFSGFCGPTLLK